MSRLPARHGKDHAPNGYDPIPFPDPDVFMAPSPSMGPMLPALQLGTGFGTGTGIVWVPAREGWTGGMFPGHQVDVLWAHADPRDDHFANVLARLHPIDDVESDLDLSVFYPAEPWMSKPWAGGSGFSHPGVQPGASMSAFTAPGGDWGGDDTADFYGFLAISDDDSDTFTFAGPGAWSEAAPYTHSFSGVGSIGYVFHQFAPSSTTNVSVTFGSGTGSVRSAGYIRIQKASGVTPTVGADVGEEDTANTVRPTVTLTDFVDPAQGLLVVSAYYGPAGWDPSDAHKYPLVQSVAPEFSNEVAMYRYGLRQYPVVKYVGGLGQPGGGVDGGSP